MTNFGREIFIGIQLPGKSRFNFS